MNAHIDNVAFVSANPVNMPLALGGVWGHSSPTYTDSYVIFCVGNDKVKEAAFRSWAHAHGIGFKSLVGSYKGIVEHSFIVNAKHLDAIRGWTVQEESILVLGPSEYKGGGKSLRPATLVFGETGAETSLGYFRQVGRDHAMAQEAWTYDPSNDTYWVCS